MAGESNSIAPEKPQSVPKNAQWLGGQGAGVWFTISAEENNYQIKRYSSAGNLDCEGLFSIEEGQFNLNGPYQFTYISHCAQCRIIQNNKVFVFNLMNHQ